MFEPSQGVLEAFRRVPQGPRAYQRPPGVSQSVLEHPGSFQECLPGVFLDARGSQKTLVSSIQRLLDGSDNFAVSLKLFQSVLEFLGPYGAKGSRYTANFRTRLDCLWEPPEPPRRSEKRCHAPEHYARSVSDVLGTPGKGQNVTRVAFSTSLGGLGTLPCQGLRL